MARSLEQDTRVGSFSTPMGKDKLVLAGFQAEEGLSELFEIRVEALSETADIDFDTTLGTGCVVSVHTHNRKQRHFHGIMVEAQSAGMAQDLHAYRIVLRPWLWLLSRVADCRIFHEKTALEIIKKVFDAHDFASGKYQLRTSKDYPKLEYCVQYRETDLAFVCRLMEQHGIYYYFEHAEGDHTMILADAKSSHKPVPGLATVNFIPDETGDQVREENIKHWSAGRHFRAGKVQLRDYNYMTPDANMTSDSDKSGKYSHGSLQLYDYPGKYKDKSEGEAYAKVRNEAEQAHDRRRFGDGDAVSLFPGGLTTLARHDTASENREYLLVRAFHELELQGYRSGNGGGGRTYTGRYEFLPSDRPFRAPALTPRPMVHGPQTALVVTEQKGGSEEIEVDKEGRIMVQFYWDRDDAKSCWVRVGQVWAGPSWGGQLIPRVGMEVIVVFLEGSCSLATAALATRECGLLRCLDVEAARGFVAGVAKWQTHRT